MYRSFSPTSTLRTCKLSTQTDLLTMQICKFWLGPQVLSICMRLYVQLELKTSTACDYTTPWPCKPPIPTYRRHCTQNCKKQGPFQSAKGLLVHVDLQLNPIPLKKVLRTSPEL